MKCVIVKVMESGNEQNEMESISTLIGIADILRLIFILHFVQILTTTKAASNNSKSREKRKSRTKQYLVPA